MKVIRLPKLNLHQRIGGKERIRMVMLGYSLVSLRCFFTSFFVGMKLMRMVFFFKKIANYVEVVEAEA